MNEGYSFIEGEQVRLWDGKLYPRARVEQAMAGLSDYANEHDTLTETAPPKLGRMIAQTGLMCAGIGSIPGVLFLLTGGSLVIAIVISLFFAILLALIQGIAFVWTSQRSRSTITVNDGQVRARLGSKTQSWPLEYFQWYRGRARQDTMLKGSVYPDVRTLVLVTRLKVRWFPAMHYKIACGFTPEMRSRWEAFLTLADVPYGRRGLDANLVMKKHNQPGQNDSEVTCDDSELGG